MYMYVWRPTKNALFGDFTKDLDAPAIFSRSNSAPRSW